MDLNRRSFLVLLPPSIGGLILAACSSDKASPADTTSPTATTGASSGSAAPAAAASAGNTQAAVQLTPTPACGDADDLTPQQTEGPYFTPNSPERTSLVESGMAGTRLVVEGLVVSKSCQPVARALVDFWQADNAGQYDNSGYRLRGHQFTDANGRYRLETIVPGLYPGRTRHIHVKVQAPSRPVLTSQLYFPGEPGNRTDGIYSAALEMQVSDASGGAKAARFDFVLNIA